MRISPVVSFNYQNKMINKKNNKNNQLSNNNINFTSGWKVEKLRILERSDKEMRELGEYFHNYKDSDLEGVATLRNLLGFKKEDSSLTAYNKLKEAVNNVRKDKNSWLSRISTLSIGEDKNAQNIADQKLFMVSQFFDSLNAERKGASVKIQNGILIHGTSREKQSFLDWVIETSKMNFNEINFDISHPIESLKTLFQSAENAKLARKLNGERTLLKINNIDDLLTDFDSIENRRNISKFKNFMERCAQDYDTTVITSTDNILDNFEPASIAPHRFDLKIELNEHLTEAERNELTALRNKVKNLDDKANRANNEFYEYDVYDNSIDYEERPWWEDPVEVYWRMG